jgi:hypothetical protein
MLAPLLAAVLLADGTATTQSFDGSGTPYALTFQEARRVRPVSGGQLYLLSPFQKNTTNAIGFDRTAEGLHQKVKVSFDLEISKGREGVGFALLSTKDHGTTGEAPEVEAWEEPNLKGSFGVGFDISNPPTKDWFDEHGNVYGRPEREVSLHWDGIEQFNKRTSFEFRGTGVIPVEILVEQTTGGSLVSVTMRGNRVYDQQFVAEMHPYEARAAFGGRASEQNAEATVDNISIEWLEPSQTPPIPTRVPVMDKQVVNGGKQTTSATARFPKSNDHIGRAVLTLSLDETPQGMDEWDRRATIRIYDDKGEAFELVRYMTPFERSWTWKTDITDYLPLLKGEKKIETWVETWTQGFAVSIDVDLYPGPIEYRPVEIRNLWNGYWEIGNKDKPFESHTGPTDVAVPAGTDKTAVRIVATGHGMSPNRDNAAEFMPIRRWLTVNGQSWSNLLWNTDVYLNPVRPQGGTWKFDRAGWGPGSISEPWKTEISSWIKPGESAKISYRLENWENTTRNPGYPASHMFASQIVFYRRS